MQQKNVADRAASESRSAFSFIYSLMSKPDKSKAIAEYELAPVGLAQRIAQTFLQ
ncbi:MAG TPA: hypothetical protein VH186_26770 [Chloroflexia bacterium]|nr:hypothetical protein [Chloroflexia bacterium]